MHPAKDIPELTHWEQDRFRAKVRKGSGCWLWTGERKSSKAEDYGVFVVRRKRYPAHRVAFALEHGRSPDPMLRVCHTCDRPRCVNPAHLVEETQTWNVADRDAKGRTARGEDMPHSVLSRAQVAEAKAAMAAGEHYALVAARFHVVPANMFNIGTGGAWAHVEPKGRVIPKRTWTDWREAELMRRDRDAGCSYQEIGERWGVSANTASRVINSSSPRLILPLEGRKRGRIQRYAQHKGFQATLKHTKLSTFALRQILKPEDPDSAPADYPP